MSLLSNWKIIIASTLLNVVLWIGLYYLTDHDPYPIILHYNGYLGPDRLGNWAGVFTLPLVGLIILILNSFLVWISGSKRLKRTLSLTVLVVEILLTIGGIAIIITN